MSSKGKAIAFGGVFLDFWKCIKNDNDVLNYCIGEEYLCGLDKDCSYAFTKTPFNEYKCSQIELCYEILECQYANTTNPEPCDDQGLACLENADCWDIWHSVDTMNYTDCWANIQCNDYFNCHEEEYGATPCVKELNLC